MQYWSSSSAAPDQVGRTIGHGTGFVNSGGTATVNPARLSRRHKIP
jgi:hypothetical protein